MEPRIRYGNPKAITELAVELNLPYNRNMQDWSYEVANPDDMDKYILHYRRATNEDKKFVLMEIIIQATESQTNEIVFMEYWQQIKPMIESDFAIHEYTVYYWCCFDQDDLNNCWTITPLMREVWSKFNFSRL